MQKDYFKGWYFKCSNDTQTIAFIPAFHRTEHRETASLQVITDDAACLRKTLRKYWSVLLQRMQTLPCRYARRIL